MSGSAGAGEARSLARSRTLPVLSLARRWPATRVAISLWQTISPAAAVPPGRDRWAERRGQVDLGGRPRSRAQLVPVARLLRSDVKRKLLLGVNPEERLPATADTREASARVYDAVRRKAAVGLGAGYTVIIDAVALTAEERHRQLLGLPLDRRLTLAEIHRAYKHVAKSAHPDAGGSAQEFLALSAAREALMKQR